MCGRFTLRTPAPELARLFGLDRVDPSELAPRYNIAPTQPIPTVRERPVAGTSRAGGRGAERPPRGPRELAFLRWGLLPGWVEDPRDWPTLINARAESLDRKPAFRDALRERRCVVPADGFFEWRREGGRKQPYLVRLEGGGPFAFAGLWERWRGRRDGEEAEVESCTIVTTEANELLRPLHDRMPVILRAEDLDLWLDPDARHYGELEALLQPLPSELLEVTPVSPRLNSPDEDDADVLEPVGKTARHPSDLRVEPASGAPDRVPEDGEDRPDGPGAGPRQLELL